MFSHLFTEHQKRALEYLAPLRGSNAQGVGAAIDTMGFSPIVHARMGARAMGTLSKKGYVIKSKMGWSLTPLGREAVKRIKEERLL